MKFRKLRIAWSVVWGVVAVLLILLWARSYWRWGAFFSPPINSTAIWTDSVQGLVYCFTAYSTGAGWDEVPNTERVADSFRNRRRAQTVAGFGVIRFVS